MDEGTLFKFGKWIGYGKSTPGVKKFPPKGAWSGSRDRFCYEATLIKFRKCIDYMASATPGVKNPPPNGCAVGHVITVQILTPLTFLDGCGGGGGSGRRAGYHASPSLSLNDA